MNQISTPKEKKRKEKKREELEQVQLITGRFVRPSVDETDLPDIADLASRLRFSLRDGRIWLDTQRVTLIHLSTLNSLRMELMTSLGIIKAQGFLTRMGYESGTRDAKLARKLRPNHTIKEAFLVGSQLRALQGVSAMKSVKLEMDTASGHFYCEFSWSDTFEEEAHTSVYGISEAPVCWMQVGYASGYASTFTGQTILFKEVECGGCGDQECHIIGKPLAEWDDIDDELRALQSEDFTNQFSDRKKIRSISATPAKGHRGDTKWHEMIGVSTGFVTACHLLKKVAPTSATVLFLGETGVGKEQFARTLHNIGPRANKPFIAINCAALPENLIESELFGVEKGAFTGAIRSRPGRFERANGGSLFLDEISTLSIHAQIKLLRVIQEREIERVGDIAIRKVDVRLIASSNVDLWKAVEAGDFREDLLFRLNIFPIHIPPLRDRKDDIPLLMDHFLRLYAKRHNRPVVGLMEDAIDVLYEYDYPGNIRELENLIERAVILADHGKPIERSHFFTGINRSSRFNMLKINFSGTLSSESNETANVDTTYLDRFLNFGTSLEEMEKQIIIESVKKANGNLAASARMLGMTRPQLAYRLKKNQSP